MRAIIVAGSPQTQPALCVQPTADDLLIAVDFGGSHCLHWGWQPDMVIGDLDSLPAADEAVLRARGCRFITVPARKDETDLELALDFAVQAAVGEIIILGAWGGRVDMSLANVLLLTRPGLAGLPVRLVEGQQTICLVQPGHPVCVEGQPGDLLSLIPVGGDAVGVTVEDVGWPLHGDSLPLGIARGVSNVLTGSSARVAVGGGRLLVVHTADAVG